MSTWFASATLWDWAVGLVAVLSILMGLWRGFVRTAFGLAAWVLAFLFTAPVSALVAPWVAGFSMPTLVLQVIVFLVLFVLCRFVGAMVSRAMRAIGLGGLDRFFGALLGAARAAVIITVVAMACVVATKQGVPLDLSWQDAHARPLLDGMVEAGFRYLGQFQPQP